MDEAAQDAALLYGVLSVLVFIFGFIWVIVAANKKKVVVFFNFLDAVGTLATIVLFILGVGTVSMYPFRTFGANNIFHALFSYECIIISIILFINNFNSAMKYNKNILTGLVVGFYKFFYILLIFGVISEREKYKREHPQAGQNFNIVGVGLIAWFGMTLFNGEAVYQAKGWELPE